MGEIEKNIQELIDKYLTRLNREDLSSQENNLYKKTLNHFIDDLEKLLDSLKVNEFQSIKEKSDKITIENYTNKMISDLDCKNYLEINPVEDSRYFNFVLNGKKLNKIVSFNLFGDIKDMTLFEIKMWIDSFKLKRLEE